MNVNDTKLQSNPYGEFAYETFRKLGHAFIDKSAVIKDLESADTPRYPVLLRPRRFGKSTFVRMLKCFYDISYKSSYDEIFSQTAIYRENLESHNTYHVLDFNFSGVSGTKEDTLVSSYIIAVSRGITNFKARYPDFVFNPTDAQKETPSGFIKSFFEAYELYPSRANLYIMIDEYDNFANGLLSKNLELFKAITSAGGFLKDFYAAIKEGTGDCVAKTFITGVSSVLSTL